MAGETITVHIEGLAEVQSALRELLPDRTARSIMRRVLIKRAQPIAAHASSLAPVDPTGQQDLKRSIKTSSTLRKSQRSAGRKNPDDVEVYIGPSTANTKAILHYAHLQEFGSSHHGPNPYLRPAWDAARGEVLKGIANDMWDEIVKAVKRADKKAAKLAAAGG
jgi:HK97 gp10 family phage protein